MKLRRKKWLAGLLALVLALSLIPGLALAGSDQDQLLIKWMDRENDLWVESDMTPEPIDSIDLTMDGSRCVRFYHYDSATDSYQVLEAEPESSKDSIFTVEMFSGDETEDGKPCYELRGVGFGSAELTCGSYTVPVTVSLPWMGFYSEREISEDTYLSRVTYDKDNGNTFWLMREEGFTAEELTNLTVTLDGETYDVLTATAEAITSTDSEGETRYDVQITLPAGLQLRAGSQWLEVQGGNGSGEPCWGTGITVSVPEQPRLLLGWLEWDEEAQAFYENEEYDLGELPPCELGNGFSVCLYYGTTRDYERVTSVEVSGSSVEVYAEPLRDGGTGWTLQCVALGESTLTVTTEDDETYTQKINVTLPEYGFYTAQSRDGAYYVSYCDYNDLPADKALWLMCEEGFTQDELDNLTVTLSGTTLTSASVTRVLRTGSSDRYDVKVTLREMEPSESWCGLQAALAQENGEPWYIANCEIAVRGAAAYAGDYVEGFYFYIADDVPFFTEGDGNYGNSHSADEYTGEYVQFQEDMKIGAATKGIDAQGGAYYKLVGSEQVQITVNKVWIESVCGTKGTFSLSQTAPVSERSDLGDSLQFPLYYQPGQEEGVLVHAELKITVNGESEPIIADVSQYCFTDVRVMETINWPVDSYEDTVEDLNRYLAEDLFNQRVANGFYTINLAGTTYTGTIQIPAGFEEKDGRQVELILVGAQDGKTVIKGGIDLNKNYLGNLENITFDGGNAETSALYNGSCLNMFGCTFKGYTGAAVDGSSGMMTVTSNNVFLDNHIAVKIDADSWEDWSSNLNPWLNNTYINNDTAVQILSLNDAVSSHNLRLYDSDFIGNGMDFDARCGGTLYFYRNYFGSFDELGSDIDPVETFSAAKALNDFTGLLTSRTAKISTANSTTVIVNPRWKYPAKNLGNPPEYSNILISDWTLPTQILNSEAGSLKLDASAFEEEGTKTITVVDEQDEPVGTWIFD